MTIIAASRQVNISYSQARRYYNAFLKNPERKIVVFAKRNKIYTQQQINTLIECIADKQLSISKASRKAKIPGHIGYAYYNEYCKDPNHNIPIPHHLRPKFAKATTKHQIAKFIGYIVDGNMKLANAASKAGIHAVTARRYYRKYKNNPNHELPVPKKRGLFGARCSQERINKLVYSIVHDKMSIKAASVIANMSEEEGKKHYQQYLKDPTQQIHTPRKHPGGFRHVYTQEQVKELIGYITNDKISVIDASIKANMSMRIARKYWNQYRHDPKHEIPCPQNKSKTGTPLTQERINQLIRCIVDDNVSINAASGMLDMNHCTAKKYYTLYLNNNKIPAPIKVSGVPVIEIQDRVKKLIGYIVDNKMPLQEAAIKANISERTAKRHYLTYLNDPNHAILVPFERIWKSFTQDQIDTLIGYIVNDNMSIEMASSKAKMSRGTANNYYQQYLNDPDHKSPLPKMTANLNKQIEKMMDYVDDDCSIAEAVKRVNMNKQRAQKFYNAYKAKKKKKKKVT
jgi:hypothetical protein